jgi:hypothetical protein
MRRPSRTGLLRRAAQYTAAHALVVAWWNAVVSPVDVGSSLTISVVGGVLSAVLAGLWLGARIAELARAWTLSRPAMPEDPWPAIQSGIRHVAAPVVVAGCLGYVAALVWCIWARATVAQVTAAHGVLLATVVAAAGVGVWLEGTLHARGLTLVYGMALWLAPLSAFLWAPAVVDHGRVALGRAAWVNPAAGVLSALGRHNIFHSAALYTSLPYADYGVSLPSPTAQGLALAAVGGALLGLRALVAHRSWSCRR